MNLRELENFSLSHAVELHSVLNPELWSGEKLKPGVRQQLLRIAEDFMDHMGVPDINVADITLTGSNAAYTYTPHSDIDLHILVDVGKLKNDELYRELFNAKKVVYNSSHDIKVHGYDVELYVEDTREPAKSLGEYSVLKDKWNRFPGKTKVALDEPAAKRKFQKLVQLAELALRSGDLSRVNNLLDTIRRYRRTGLERSGEFSPENIAFKALRSRGIVDKLYSHSNKLHSKELSLAERGGQIVNDDWHPNDTPPGPETKPTMPRGTVRVDVSDVYDWYKLGQHISNLHGLGKHDFGKGPPSTIMSFGSEDTEHRYIKDLEATGLTTTDIDPLDPRQPKGMKRQKVDPTYNVTEAFNQPYLLKWEKGDFGDVDALARLDDGTYLHIMFNRDGGNQWVVEFLRGDSQEVTGEGDAQRVFATVLSAIRKFITKKKPDELSFSAVKEDDPTGSRTKLYDRLVQRYATGLGYNLERTELPGQMAYKLIRAVNIKESTSENVIPTKTLNKLYHVGSLNAEKKRDGSYEGSGLSVSTHPDAWRKIARGHVTGDTFSAEKSNNVFIDAHKLDKQAKEKITEWGVKNGLIEPAIIYRVSYYDDELESEVYSDYDSLEKAKHEADDLLEIKKIKDGYKPTDKLKTIAKNSYITSTGILDYILPIFAEKNGYDGVWWQDRLDVLRYSAPRGVIVPSKVPSWQFKLIPAQGVSESASGYIPSGAERNDPRYKTGLTVDVKPDSIKKNAKKLGLGNIHRSGVPPTARSDGLVDLI